VRAPLLDLTSEEETQLAALMTACGMAVRKASGG
jgi:hypothetical protein